MKQDVTLQFPSLNKLWAFRLEIDAVVFEFNTSQRTITCQCSKEHIKLAVEKHGATIIETRKEST